MPANHSGAGFGPLTAASVWRLRSGCSRWMLREGRRVVRTILCFFFQAEDGIRDYKVTGVQTCALPISPQPPIRESTAPLQEQVKGKRTTHRSCIRASPQRASLSRSEHETPTGDQGERSEEHTSELQSPCNLVCRLLLEKKNRRPRTQPRREPNSNLTASSSARPHYFWPPRRRGAHCRDVAFPPQLASRSDHAQQRTSRT